MAKQKQQTQSDEFQSEPVDRLELIKQAAINIMKRNFTPDERELDLNSWGLDDE